jgi:hypothetical protein
MSFALMVYLVRGSPHVHVVGNAVYFLNYLGTVLHNVIVVRGLLVVTGGYVVKGCSVVTREAVSKVVILQKKRGATMKGMIQRNA